MRAGVAESTGDLLDRAIERVRPHLNRSRPLPERMRVLWAGVAAARNFGSADIVAEAFMRLAVTSGLAADLGRHAEEDLRHVIRWGLFDRDPFGRARL
jgi:hypothetical protein